MITHSTGNRYHPLSIGAHWLTLALLVVVYTLIELHGFYPKGSSMREALKTWHFMFGLVVFCIVLARLVARASFRAPPIEPPLPPWQQQLAAAMHVVLYVFLVAMPLLGWVTLSAKGQPIPFFGLELPALLAPDKALGKSLEAIHKTFGTVGYYLIGLHALAGLYHHYVTRDNTLRRMLPWR